MKTYLTTILIVFFIYLIPTQNFGGIPIRPEDLIFIFIILTIPKIGLTIPKVFYQLLALSLIASFLSIVIQIFKGYIPVLGDLNTILSLLRNFVIFYSALKLGSLENVNLNKLIVFLSLGFFASAIISIIQFYNIGGLGTFFYLLYGKEAGIEYGINRTVGVAGNPNYAAFYQINGLIGLACLNYSRKKSLDIIFIILGILCVISVYVTFSRTGIISLILLFIAILLYNKKNVLLLILVGLFIVIFPFLGTLLANTRYEGLINSEEQNNAGSILTLNGRLDGIWAQKLNAFFENPLFGISSAKGIVSNTTFDTIIYDNSFLYLLVTGGIIGLIVNILFNLKIISFFKNKKVAETNSIYKYILLLHINIFIFYITTDLFKTVQFTTFYFFVTGLLITQSKLKDDKHENSTYISSNIKLE